MRDARSTADATAQQFVAQARSLLVTSRSEVDDERVSNLDRR